MVVQAQTCQVLRLNIAGFTGKTKLFSLQFSFVWGILFRYDGRSSGCAA